MAEAGDRISTGKRMEIWKAGAMQFGRRTLDAVFRRRGRHFRPPHADAAGPVPCRHQSLGNQSGGPKIVERTAAALSLTDEQTRTSVGVLADYGNCASPTILLVLERILKCERPRTGAFGILLAFGPGLTIEGAVLRF
jgi:hypothetical protein